MNSVKNKLRRFWRLFQFHGVSGFALAAGRRIFPPQSRSVTVCHQLITGRSGLEIGGPSGAFAATGLLPLYPVVAALDNCNFASETIWEGSLKEGPHFLYDTNRPRGHQYIGEAGDLSRIATGKYEFILSSHVLEHLANPLQALQEWKRVLGPKGALILIVPHKEGTFDHRRPVTPMTHLIEDLQKGTTEHDLTHLDEVLALHDLDIHPGGCELESLRERSLKNFENRCLHQHVFDTSLLMEVVNHAGFQLRAIEAVRPFHIVLVAQKPPDGEAPNNDAFLKYAPAGLATSPFPGDRQNAARRPKP